MKISPTSPAGRSQDEGGAVDDAAPGSAAKQQKMELPGDNAEARDEGATGAVAAKSTREDIAAAPEGAEDAKRKKKRKLRRHPDAPKRFKSPYIFFSVAVRDAVKQSMASNAKVTDIVCEIAERWRLLAEPEKQLWRNISQMDKQRYEREMKDHKGPIKVLKRRLKKPKDFPKRTMSAFLMYSQEQRPSLRKRMPTVCAADLSRILASEWHGLSDEAKHPYVERERQERQQYNESVREYRQQQASQAENSKDQEEDKNGDFQELIAIATAQTLSAFAAASNLKEADGPDAAENDDELEAAQAFRSIEDAGKYSGASAEEALRKNGLLEPGEKINDKQLALLDLILHDSIASIPVLGPSCDEEAAADSAMIAIDDSLRRLTAERSSTLSSVLSSYMKALMSETMSDGEEVLDPEFAQARQAPGAQMFSDFESGLRIMSSSGSSNSGFHSTSTNNSSVDSSTGSENASEDGAKDGDLGSGSAGETGSGGESNASNPKDYASGGSDKEGSGSSDGYAAETPDIDSTGSESPSKSS